MKEDTNSSTYSRIYIGWGCSSTVNFTTYAWNNANTGLVVSMFRNATDSTITTTIGDVNNAALDTFNLIITPNTWYKLKIEYMSNIKIRIKKWLSTNLEPIDWDRTYTNTTSWNINNTNLIHIGCGGYSGANPGTFQGAYLNNVKWTIP
jgi:hypothetical protein